MSLLRVAASPSIDYEAHTFECARRLSRYTARIETPTGIRKLRSAESGALRRYQGGQIRRFGH